MEIPKKVAFYTFGCKLNFSETDAIARQFGEQYQQVDFKDKADVYVINSCSVTEHANKKCRQLISRTAKLAPDAKIVVVGCYSQLKPEEIAEIDAVDLVLGTKEKFNIVNRLSQSDLQLDRTAAPAGKIHSCEIGYVSEYESSYSLEGRTRSFLKVQDGCDYACTYCTIPMARGKSRNPQISNIVEQARHIAEQGVKEIILAGVNIGDFGRSTGESFFDLVKALDTVEGIDRYRISSIEPNLLTDEIITYLATSARFVPHFHIPLQSGSDAVLRLMKRRYNTAMFAKRIEQLHRTFDQPCIGIDVIVGSPGETAEYFDECFAFLRELDFAYLHVFSYSHRENTEAVDIFPKVNERDKKMRSDRLHDLSDRKKLLYYNKFVGTEQEVLLEAGSDNGLTYGFTRNYIKVGVPYRAEWVNTLQRVRLDSLLPNGNAKGTII